MSFGEDLGGDNCATDFDVDLNVKSGEDSSNTPC